MRLEIRGAGKGFMLQYTGFSITLFINGRAWKEIVDGYDK
ncbi:hypothetical protein SAMN05421736_101844 [Evansella caseinilytica]|uniref:Uncharacterized protein n=1 Tax=Evansella caseinilytica TaxID=1503961 RepID=A0A1H3IK34_9BACI|nr:hypothetical protein SAMN05421736_101844 [Evansella caseinilytica]